MIDVFVSKFSKPVAASLVLYYASEIIWICLCADRATGNCRTIRVHHTNSFVCRGIHKHNGEGLCKNHRRVSFLSPGKARLSGRSKNSVLREITAELGINHSVDGTDVAFVGHRNYSLHIEVILVCFVRLKVKEMTIACLRIVKEGFFGYIFCVISFTDEDDIYAGTCCRSLVCGDIAVRIVIIVLLNIEGTGIVFLIKKEYDFSSAAFVIFA